MSEADLRKAEAAYRAAFLRAEAKRAERNRLVREALNAGWTHARIAEATCLSRARIGQMR